ncbi:uncharacterized protein LOC114527635 [Dendronephthya gigantea]|uniref:uncharacterized protein LOC114527635 n=1 Tax=Dendronephthya gigantea TaxID=151771 RepID=UPI00106CC678|nr:uncharacterized protein LOC114527635 [Dendronephthya gigantea]
MTKLTKMEITRVSRMVAMDWDSLAGLMDIPYEEREEIRTNHAKYPDSLSKAEEILIHFNDSDCFDRDVLAKSLVELGRRDLKDELLPMLDEVYKTRSVLRLKAETVKKTGKSKGDGTEEIQELQTEIVPEGNDQPLSPREMFRLSRRIAVDWDSLAGLIGVAQEQRDEIRCNVIYSDNRSRAEKILSIFNHRNEFSRERLVECLKELERYDLIETIITGKWKFL